MKRVLLAALAALVLCVSSATAGVPIGVPDKKPSNISFSGFVALKNNYALYGYVYYPDPVVWYEIDAHIRLTKRLTLTLGVWQSQPIDGGDNFGFETDGIIGLSYATDNGWTFNAGYAYFALSPDKSSKGDLNAFSLGVTSPTVKLNDWLSANAFAQGKYYVPVTTTLPEQGYIASAGVNLTAQLNDKLAFTLTPSAVFDGDPFNMGARVVPAVAASMSYTINANLTASVTYEKWFPSEGTDHDVSSLTAQLGWKF